MFRRCTAAASGNIYKSLPCDFSNADFSNSSFRRTIWRDCKGVGADFSECSFRDTVFDSDELLDQMQLAPKNWLSWYTRRDLYSREKLAADLETIRSYYLNQGYLDFRIDSVQVSVAPNKSDVFITINLTEGKQYRLDTVTLSGDLLNLNAEVEPLLEFEKEAYGENRT